MQTKFLIYIIIGVLVVAGVAGASYYFVIKQPVEAPSPPSPEVTVPPPEEAPPEEAPSVEKEKSISVISPNGGENWIEGNTYDIIWISPGIEKIDIEIASGGKDKGHIAFGIDAKLGKYSWKIPVGLITGFGVSKSDLMKVRISETNNPSIYDENDNYFSIGSE